MGSVQIFLQKDLPIGIIDTAREQGSIVDMVIKMKVDGLLFDPRSGMYILLLKAVDGEETLPIWIGKPEADSIA
ncbi:protein containing DUF151, partial [Candidatus Magnetobacterium bavaricum]